MDHFSRLATATVFLGFDDFSKDESQTPPCTLEILPEISGVIPGSAEYTSTSTFCVCTFESTWSLQQWNYVDRKDYGRIILRWGFPIILFKEMFEKKQQEYFEMRITSAVKNTNWYCFEVDRLFISSRESRDAELTWYRLFHSSVNLLVKCNIYWKLPHQVKKWGRER